MGPVPLAEVNAMPASAVDGLFRQCVAVGRWARELAEARPFDSVAALLARADELTAGLTDAEIGHALADHPRIGERAAGNRTTAAMSAAEQSQVDTFDAERFRGANAEYERRFGHLYLVCADGRDGADLLADLTARLANDPVTELGVVRAELGRIARLRLGRMVT
jgi:2-oxo-4-hydroxy-4-carboxy-5-ureidoimidazoline decarboxylase